MIDFNPETGEVRHRHTHQGAFHESSWSRGQAWGLYGYVMSYRFTELPEFLEQAEKIAGFILNHPRLPADLIPYWDFDAEHVPSEPRDASAAAITAPDPSPATTKLTLPLFMRITISLKRHCENRDWKVPEV